ncbi:uncharacterized protein [Miscanthus floridulus]|uniref:uncharacterized protein n=1 Tax=Miscanthus floridulus TaxID=154761 RepID=UPI00345A5ECE
MRFKKVLIDGGSALNILFARALTELGLTKDDLVHVDSPFWGIVPDFEMAYHAILGGPALAKFMVMPHYVYLVLKIPIEQGILNLCDNISTTYECKREGLAIAKAMDLSARMEACIADSKKVHTYKSYDPTSVI